MNDTERLILAFGCNIAAFPDNTPAVWGARLIAPSDLVHDRQDLQSRNEDDKQALIAWLNGSPAGTGAIAKMQDFLRNQHEMSDYKPEVVTLHEDDEGIIQGSTQGSFGYIYVAGWLKTEPVVCAGTGNHDGQTVDDCDECNSEKS